MRLQAVRTLIAALAIAVSANAAAQVPLEIKIGIGGPLTTTSAGFGVEMRQAVDLAIDERNSAGGLDGTKVIGVAIDDKADAAEGKAVAKAFATIRRSSAWSDMSTAASPSRPARSTRIAASR